MHCCLAQLHEVWLHSVHLLPSLTVLTLATAVYREGLSGDQSVTGPGSKSLTTTVARSPGVRVTTVRLPAAPYAPFAPPILPLARLPPLLALLGAATNAVALVVTRSWPLLMIVTAMSTVAECAVMPNWSTPVMCGVVTRTPSVAMCTSSTTLSHTCLLMPEPEYHRDVLPVVLARTATTFLCGGGSRCAVRSYSNGV